MLAVTPGFFAFTMKLDERDAWGAWLKTNAATVAECKTWQGKASAASLFEVKANTAWPFDNWPVKAEQGCQTDLGDLMAKKDADPSLLDIGKDLKESIRDAGRSAKTALNVMLWGGAAILLLNLFRRTAPEGD